MKHVNLTWVARFEADEEVEEFTRLIGRVHSWMYGATVAEKQLVNKGIYIGAANTITIQVVDVTGDKL